MKFRRWLAEFIFRRMYLPLFRRMSAEDQLAAIRRQHEHERMR